MRAIASPSPIVMLSTLARTPPTLEELPPVKGSILELHSIGSRDFDGLIVEFVSIDKNSGKYYVASMKDDQGLRVKPKLCRRPQIKPLKLRKALEEKTHQIAGAFKLRENSELFQASMRQLLFIDPCCAPAFMVLGAIGCGANAADSKEVQKEGIRNLERGLATLYAYEEIVTEDTIQLCKAQLSFELGDAGRFKAAGRLELGQLPQYEMLGDASKAWQEYYAGERLMKSAGDLEQQEHDTREFQKLIGAVDRYLECVRMATDFLATLPDEKKKKTLPDEKTNPNPKFGLDNLVNMASMRIAKIFLCFSKVGVKLVSASLRERLEEQREESKYVGSQTAIATPLLAANPHGFENGISIMNRVVNGVRDLYAACTTENGKHFFLSGLPKETIDDIYRTTSEGIEKFTVAREW